MAAQLFEGSATYQDRECSSPEPGSGICRSMAEAEQRCFGALPCGNVVSPATEARTRASNGSCGRHPETSPSFRYPMAPSGTYGSIPMERRRLLAKRPRNRPRLRLQRCDPKRAKIGLFRPACGAEDEAARRAREVLAAGLDSGSLREAWDHPEGLCGPRFVQTRELYHQSRVALDGHEANVLDQLGADVNTHSEFRRSMACKTHSAGRGGVAPDGGGNGRPVPRRPDQATARRAHWSRNSVAVSGDIGWDSERWPLG